MLRLEQAQSEKDLFDILFFAFNVSSYIPAPPWNNSLRT